MLKFKNIFKTAAISMLSAASFLSCMEMEDPQSGAVGYLAAPSFDVDITVQDLTETKASKPSVESPSEVDFHFVVRDKDGNVKYDADGLWAESLVLPVGAYTVEATYGSNSFGAPYFTGKASGSIAPLDQESPALTVSLANSLVCVELDSEFAQHFDVGSSKALLKSGSASAEVEYGQWQYVPSGADLEVTMTGTTAGESVSLTHKLSSPSPKVAYNLICKKSSTSWPSITWPSTALADGAFEGGLYFSPATASNMSAENAASLAYEVKGGSYSDWTEVTVSDVNGYKYISGLSNGVTYSLRACVGNILSEELSFTPVTFQSCFSIGSVTAAHNNAGNADVELSSTTMTANNMTVNLPATIAKMASVTAAGSFASSNNAATGSFSSVALSSTVKNVSFTNASDWPYLPQGTYSATVTATCTLNGAEYTASLTASPSVAAPVFSLTMTSYTSYDKYAGTNNITKDVNSTSGANSCDPATLYNAGGKWGLSTSLMSNANYAKKFVVKIDTDESRTFNVTGEYADNKYYENISGLSWDSHDLTVSVTFDGTTVQKSQTHHITGLPYSITFIANGSYTGWSTSNIRTYTTYSDYIRMDEGSSYLLSPEFYIPEAEVSAQAIVPARGYSSLAGQFGDPKLYVSAASSAVQGGTTHSIASGIDPVIDDKFKDYSTLVTLTSTSKRLSIYGTVTTSSWCDRCIFVKSCTVKYQ